MHPPGVRSHHYLLLICLNNHTWKKWNGSFRFQLMCLNHLEFSHILESSFCLTSIDNFKIVDKVWNKLSAWKAKFLSPAGQLTDNGLFRIITCNVACSLLVFIVSWIKSTKIFFGEVMLKRIMTTLSNEI